MKEKILFFLKHFEEIIAGILFLSMVIIINVEVFNRYFLLSPGAYSEEIAKYLFIWSVFFAMVYAVKENGHIITDVIPDRTPVHIQKLIDITSILIFIAFSIFMIYHGIVYTIKMYQFERLSEAMGAPLYYFCVSVPIGFSLVLLRLFQQLIKKIKVYSPSQKHI
ncbi:MAG: TRAP transporter small permease [Desulfobacterales bacterium]|nr:TRAP transporter small permease [Deltaproteobacteria bacterium]NNK93082.1 TRAP transporter small permease [Desulfobacterales bacterium]